MIIRLSGPLRRNSSWWLALGFFDDAPKPLDVAAGMGAAMGENPERRTVVCPEAAGVRSP
jgi:hypothetical protein